MADLIISHLELGTTHTSKKENYKNYWFRRNLNRLPQHAIGEQKMKAVKKKSNSLNLTAIITPHLLIIVYNFQVLNTWRGQFEDRRHVGMSC